MVPGGPRGQASSAARVVLRAGELPCELPRIVPQFSPGRFWKAVRRDVKRGWSAAYHEHQTLPRIEKWQWPFWGEKPHTVPVHVLTGEADWRLAAWTLASWFCATGIGWPVVLHDDGTLSENARALLGQMFGGLLRILSRDEVDSVMGLTLRAFPFCEDFRSTHPFARKVFDTAHFSEGEHFIVLDHDVLIFQEPREILAWADVGAEKCWFMEDAVEGSIITAAEARDELDVKLWRRVGSGISLLRKPVIDLDFCDRALAQTSILKGPPERIASTLLALCASAHGAGGLLPRSYEVSQDRRAAKDAIARHYAGTEHDRFFSDGLDRIHESVLAFGED